MRAEWRERCRRSPHAIDAALVVVTFGLSVIGSMSTPVHGGEFLLNRTPSVAVLVLAAVACLALMWNRDRPRTVVVVTMSCCVVIGALTAPLTPLLLGSVTVALYALATHTDRYTARTYSVGAAIILVVVSVAFGKDVPVAGPTIGLGAWVLLAGAIGDSVRSRRDYVAAVEARAELAERTREDEARHRVDEERMRIARELHDVVAHHMALANAQAGVASYVLSTRPDQAQQMLTQLAETTSSALRELKATVGLLRQSGDAEAPLEPAPGLDTLPGLVESFAGVGLSISVTIEGEPRPLSPGVDLTAYRIVQEALTNVAKHARTSSASVVLTYSRRSLRIRVIDAGRGGVPGETGYGLLGMRERALSMGGRLFAGRRPEGGFEVSTELPLHTVETLRGAGEMRNAGERTA
ncbi:sensor histidine kinase [Nocardia sp. NPDC088792]|uniref:sensor histidine kinase n=1 Tax=Nocardia sp. NPDC088792 TaxID=3364332 RepID=UPI003800B901